MPEVSILLLGETDRAEFRDFPAALEALGRVSCVSEAQRAIQVLETGELTTDVIVIAQAFPRQFSHVDIDRLRRLAPLSRVVVLLGSWCEGETRSGQPLPGAIRIYWHQWHARAERELRRLIQSQCPSWGLPVTATEEERLLESAAQGPSSGQGLIAICARGYATADWLSEACRTCGYSTAWLHPPHYTQVKGAVAAIFDGSDLNSEEIEQLATLTNALGRTPVIALLDFPRIEDQRRAISAGASAVLSKPLNLDDLFWQLDRVSNVVPG
jgi:DNA-binding NarL/FixJ family response regulator